MDRITSWDDESKSFVLKPKYWDKLSENDFINIIGVLEESFDLISQQTIEVLKAAEKAQQIAMIRDSLL